MSIMGPTPLDVCLAHGTRICPQCNECHECLHDDDFDDCGYDDADELAADVE